MSKILVIDNYDSFTFNLVHQLRSELKVGVDVFRNDKIELSDIDLYDSILLSPGPGIPKEAGIMPEILKTFATKKKILGVCLGHQGIAENFGSSLLNLDKIVHGKAYKITTCGEDNKLYKGLPSSFTVGRYHSWVVDPQSLGSELIATSHDEEGNIMSLRHKDLPVYGVQYHPESILTENGLKIIENWLAI